MADVPRFLNRLLGLGPEAQRRIFDYYQQTLEALMEQERQRGHLGEWGRGWVGGREGGRAGFRRSENMCSVLKAVCPDSSAFPTLGPPPPPADEGIVDVTAHSVTLKGEPRVLHRDATTGATTGGCMAALPLLVLVRSTAAAAPLCHA